MENKIESCKIIESITDVLKHRISLRFNLFPVRYSHLAGGGMFMVYRKTKGFFLWKKIKELHIEVYSDMTACWLLKDSSNDLCIASETELNCKTYAENIDKLYKELKNSLVYIRQ